MAQIISIKMSKFDNQPWGFRLQGGIDFSAPLTVQKVNGGSLAEKAGLCVGDNLVRVNSTDIYQMRHKEAQDTVSRAGNNFELIVSRGGGMKPKAVEPLHQPSNGEPLPSSMLPVNQQKNDVKLVNNQFNSPMGLYSEENIAETLSSQAEVLAQGVLGVNFKKNEKTYDPANSEVFKMVQEIDRQPKELEPESPRPILGRPIEVCPLPAKVVSNFSNFPALNAANPPPPGGVRILPPAPSAQKQMSKVESELTETTSFHQTESYHNTTSTSFTGSSCAELGQLMYQASVVAPLQAPVAAAPQFKPVQPGRPQGFAPVTAPAPAPAPTFAPAPTLAPAPAFAPAPAPVRAPVNLPPAPASEPPKGTGSGIQSAPRRGMGILKSSAPGARIPVCSSCNAQIRGKFVTALGLTWCPDHFVCAMQECRRSLQDVGFVEEKKALYCEGCFENYLAPCCTRCQKRVKGDCLNAIGKQFHPECFACTYCGRLFGNSHFYLEDGLPYCESDWNELFTTKCFACGYPIEAGDRWVEAMNNNYHSQCFTCAVCKKNLEGQSFLGKGGRPICKSHAAHAPR